MTILDVYKRQGVLTKVYGYLYSVNKSLAVKLTVCIEYNINKALHLSLIHI